MKWNICSQTQPKDILCGFWKLFKLNFDFDWLPEVVFWLTKIFSRLHPPKLIGISEWWLKKVIIRDWLTFSGCNLSCALYCSICWGCQELVVIGDILLVMRSSFITIASLAWVMGYNEGTVFTKWSFTWKVLMIYCLNSKLRCCAKRKH